MRRRDKLKRAAARLAQSNGRLPVKRRRGPREAQEIIRALFAARPSEAFLTKDLCEIIHPNLPTRRNIAETNLWVRMVVAADPIGHANYLPISVRWCSSTAPMSVAWKRHEHCWRRSRSGRVCAGHRGSGSDFQSSSIDDPSRSPCGDQQLHERRGKHAVAPCLLDYSCLAWSERVRSV